jgi:hypothetical protein
VFVARIGSGEKIDVAYRGRDELMASLLALYGGAREVAAGRRDDSRPDVGATVEGAIAAEN